jgi:hypothetical protein
MRRLFRPRVVLGTLAGFIALYTLFGFVLVPSIIKSYVVEPTPLTQHQKLR